MDSDRLTLAPSSTAPPLEEGIEVIPTRRRRAVRRENTEGITLSNLLNIQPLPRWITVSETADLNSGNPLELAHTKASGEAAFAAGAALHALDQILRAEPLFLGALKMRLALHAAAAASRLFRAGADEADLRDTLHLTRAGDEPGLVGRVHLILRRLAVRPLRLASEGVVELKNLGDSTGLHEIEALLAEDFALAMRLGWQQPLPLHLLAIHDSALRRGDEGRRIRIGEPEWAGVRHAVIARAAIKAHAEAVTLAHRTKTLITAADTLRTRDSGTGLALILGDDCVAPWRMAGRGDKGRAGLGSDRAARRFCESLHAQGALRLLTSRPTFRLYGL
jgi:hypothetical protein